MNLTIKQINNLNVGHEIDALITEHIFDECYHEWETHKYHGWETNRNLNKIFSYFYKCKKCSIEHHGLFRQRPINAEYSNNVCNAFQVADKMRGNEEYPKYELRIVHIEWFNKEKPWEICFVPWEWDMDNERIPYVYTDDPALGICKAALAIKLETKS